MRGRKGLECGGKGLEGRAEVAAVEGVCVCVKGMGHKSPEEQVVLVLLLIEQLAVRWLYPVNAMNAFAAIGRYDLFKDIKPHFLQFCAS